MLAEGVGLKSIPSDTEQKAGDTMNKSPVCPTDRTQDRIIQNPKFKIQTTLLIPVGGDQKQKKTWYHVHKDFDFVAVLSCFYFMVLYHIFISWWSK